MEFADVERARALLASHFPPTRLVRAGSLSRQRGAPVYLKLESELPTGSFKPRGALYALSCALARGVVREVVASSTGNHGAAVAYAAHLLGVPARIFLPGRPNPTKRARIAELGASIVEGGADSTIVFERASEYAQRTGAFFLNDASDADLPAGPATIACELLEQAPDVRELIVPVGDTALIRGIAFAAKRLRPGIRVIGVQAAQAPGYCLSWKARRPISTETCDTIADGLATRTSLDANVQSIVDLVDDMRLVSEEEMLEAIRHLLIEEHLVAEPAGAAPAAALLQQPASGAPAAVALILTGANIAPDVLRAAVTRDAAPRAAR